MKAFLLALAHVCLGFGTSIAQQAPSITSSLCEQIAKNPAGRIDARKTGMASFTCPSVPTYEWNRFWKSHIAGDYDSSTFWNAEPLITVQVCNQTGAQVAAFFTLALGSGATSTGYYLINSGDCLDYEYRESYIALVSARYTDSDNFWNQGSNAVVCGKLNWFEERYSLTENRCPYGTMPVPAYRIDEKTVNFSGSIPPPPAQEPDDLSGGEMVALGLVVAGIAAALLSSDSDEPSQTKRHSGSSSSDNTCESTARSKISTCYVTTRSCNSVGCTYDNDCTPNRGWCHLADYGPGTFYCETNNSNNNSKNYNEVVRKMCD